MKRVITLLVFLFVMSKFVSAEVNPININGRGTLQFTTFNQTFDDSYMGLFKTFYDGNYVYVFIVRNVPEKSLIISKFYSNGSYIMSNRIRLDNVNGFINTITITDKNNNFYCLLQTSKGMIYTLVIRKDKLGIDYITILNVKQNYVLGDVQEYVFRNGLYYNVYENTTYKFTVEDYPIGLKLDNGSYLLMKYEDRVFVDRIKNYPLVQFDYSYNIMNGLILDLGKRTSLYVNDYRSFIPSKYILDKLGVRYYRLNTVRYIYDTSQVSFPVIEDNDSYFIVLYPNWTIGNKDIDFYIIKISKYNGSIDWIKEYTISNIITEKRFLFFKFTRVNDRKDYLELHILLKSSNSYYDVVGDYLIIRIKKEDGRILIGDDIRDSGIILVKDNSHVNYMISDVNVNNDYISVGLLERKIDKTVDVIFDDYLHYYVHISTYENPYGIGKRVMKLGYQQFGIYGGIYVRYYTVYEVDKYIVYGYSTYYISSFRSSYYTYALSHLSSIKRYDYNHLWSGFKMEIPLEYYSYYVPRVIWGKSEEDLTMYGVSIYNLLIDNNARVTVRDYSISHI